MIALLDSVSVREAYRGPADNRYRQAVGRPLDWGSHPVLRISYLTNFTKGFRLLL